MNYNYRNATNLSLKLGLVLTMFYISIPCSCKIPRNFGFQSCLHLENIVCVQTRKMNRKKWRERIKMKPILRYTGRRHKERGEY